MGGNNMKMIINALGFSMVVSIVFINVFFYFTGGVNDDFPATFLTAAAVFAGLALAKLFCKEEEERLASTFAILSILCLCTAFLI